MYCHICYCTKLIKITSGAYSGADPEYALLLPMAYVSQNDALMACITHFTPSQKCL